MSYETKTEMANGKIVIHYGKTVIEKDKNGFIVSKRWIEHHKEFTKPLLTEPLIKQFIFKRRCFSCNKLKMTKKNPDKFEKFVCKKCQSKERQVSLNGL